jgi:hypothetical protein
MSIKPLIVALCATLLLAACATPVAGHPSAAPSKSVATSTAAPPSSATPSGSSPGEIHAILASAAVSSWAHASDAASGVTFQLPVKPSRTTRTNAGIEQLLYTAALHGDDASVSVGIVAVGSEDQSANVVEAYADRFEAEFRASGAKDLAITEKRTCNVEGHTCRDMRIGFTPLDDPNGTTLWLVRAIADGPDVILLQTIVVVPKSEQAADLPLVRTIQRRAEESLDLP